MSKVFAVTLFFALCTPVLGQVPGNLLNQERSDVVFRDLALPLNTHSAIYLDYFDANTSRAGNPQDLTWHSVIQMTGVVSAPLGFVSDVEGIQVIGMQAFENAAGFFGDYLGSYDNLKQTVIPRGASSDYSMSRMAIQRSVSRLLELTHI